MFPAKVVIRVRVLVGLGPSSGVPGAGGRITDAVVRASLVIVVLRNRVRLRARLRLKLRPRLRLRGMMGSLHREKPQAAPRSPKMICLYGSPHRKKSKNCHCQGFTETQVRVEYR